MELGPSAAMYIRRSSRQLVLNMPVFPHPRSVCPGSSLKLRRRIQMISFALYVLSGLFRELFANVSFIQKSSHTCSDLKKVNKEPEVQGTLPIKEVETAT